MTSRRFVGLVAGAVGALAVVCGGVQGQPLTIGHDEQAGAPEQVASDKAPPSALVRPEALVPFWEAAWTRRVDVVGIGDSNQLYFANGWDDGMSKALYQRFGMYATAVMPSGAASTQGYGFGGQIFPAELPRDSGLPAELAAYWQNVVNVPPSMYGFVKSGNVFTQQAVGIRMEWSCPIDVTGPLRFHLAYGAGPWGNGSFQPGFRHDDPPYAGTLDGAVVSTFDASGYSMRVAQFDVPAGGRAGGAVYGGYSRQAGTPIVGPFFGTVNRCENVSKAHGIAFSSLVYDGGRSLRSMASRICVEMTEQQFGYYLEQVVRLQNTTSPMVLVVVNSGFNDRQETLPSLGPRQVSVGSSASAYADNLDAVRRRFESAFVAHGWDPAGLFLLVVPSHPIALPDDPMLHGYRAAARSYALSTPRTAMVDLEMLTNANEMQARGWYRFDGRAHLNLSGYEDLGERIFANLIGAAQASDVNRDGETNLADVAVLIDSWGDAVPPGIGADADGDGRVGIGDLAMIVQRFGERWAMQGVEAIRGE